MLYLKSIKKVKPKGKNTMALLTLKDVGKIYVSDGNVSVGIRGVNLSFDRGEFVAVTGKSGSGKSTLLNVISGMDSYEEGELYIEGQPTSHYMQYDWEQYRKEYISFIFQDYNIIESFTVLQNVELSLMHISDKKERRKRALELLDRVGMTSHIKHKGSKLSGGQKQRTVIARALAKDSPIILADEPTGNLDSATSKEIIELLREVSKDKLLIVVTHNFEQVEQCATRHIRVFDGAIESDHVISHVEAVKETASQEKLSKSEKRRGSGDIRNGIALGRAIFGATPKLSFFFCMLMIIGALGIFLVTSLCASASEIFEKSYMFERIDGRVIITTRDGSVISSEDAKKLADDFGADSYLRYDVLLDEEYANRAKISLGGGRYDFIDIRCTYNEDFGDDIIGRYPKKDGEVFLYLPISQQDNFGKDAIETDKIQLNNVEVEVVGIKYFYDNNLDAKCLLTEKGFDTITAMYYLCVRSYPNITLYGNSDKNMGNRNMILSSYDLEDSKIFIPDISKNNGVSSVSIDASYQKYDYYGSIDHSNDVFSVQKIFGEEYFSDGKLKINTYGEPSSSIIVMSPDLVREIAFEVLEKSYRQMSLFYENNEEASEAAKKLYDAGYIAVTSEATYEPDAFEIIVGLISGIMMAFLWVMAIIFLAFFIGLCSSRTLGAFKGDMAIMRSMGIPVRSIKVGMYVRMLMALIPAYICVCAAAYLIFTSPSANEHFVYLYAWHYAVIFVGMLLLTVRITRKQVKKLFDTSVKKSLKGGAAE